MPKLSVIVPVYNTEKYLRECIDSILAQTFIDFELIIVDDGSTDNSGAICDEYAQVDQRIRVIHQNNAGVTKARKVGALLSKGDYVTYVDSDDWIDSDTYKDMMCNIEKHDADMGVFAMMIEKHTPVPAYNRVGEGFFSKEMLEEKVYPKLLFDYSINQSAIIASLCNKIIKREILQTAILNISDNLDYGEDAITGYLSILNSATIYICNTPFYHYRENLSSISHANVEVMRKRVLALDTEMRRCFSAYASYMSCQIDGHIARHTVEQVRAELLYSTEKSYYERRCLVRDFCKHPQIDLALKKAYLKICDKKEKIKVLFIKLRLFGLLYLLFKKV